MKKCVSLLLAFLLIAALPVCALAENRLEKILAAGKLTVATSPDFAPAEFIDPTKTGQESIVGEEMLLAYYIAEQLGVELVIEAMDFSAVQGAVSQAKIDLGISGFSPTPERAESMELSDPYEFEVAENEQGLLVRTEDSALYASLEDFAGKKVAAQNGSLQQNLVNSQLPDSKIELITNLNDAVMMLITGKVDAIASSYTSGVAYAVNYPGIEMSSVFFDWRSPGNVIMATKGEAELIARVNEIIAQAKDEGLFEQWHEETVALLDSLSLNNSEDE